MVAFTGISIIVDSLLNNVCIDVYDTSEHTMVNIVANMWCS